MLDDPGLKRLTQALVATTRPSHLRTLPSGDLVALFAAVAELPAWLRPVVAVTAAGDDDDDNLGLQSRLVGAVTERFLVSESAGDGDQSSFLKPGQEWFSLASRQRLAVARGLAELR